MYGATTSTPPTAPRLWPTCVARRQALDHRVRDATRGREGYGHGYFIGKVWEGLRGSTVGALWRLRVGLSGGRWRGGKGARRKGEVKI